MRFPFPFFRKKEEELLTLPRIFERCPNPKCRSEETITKIAARTESVLKGKSTSLEQITTFLQDPYTVSLPQVRAIVTHYDVCAKCGTRYCVKAEINMLPVVGQQNLNNLGRPRRG